MVWPAKEQFSNGDWTWLNQKTCGLDQETLGLHEQTWGLHQPKGPVTRNFDLTSGEWFDSDKLLWHLLWFTIFDKSRSGNPCWLWVRVVFHHWCLVGLHVWDCLGARLMKRGWSHNSKVADPMKDAYVLQRKVSCPCPFKKWFPHRGFAYVCWQISRSRLSNRLPSMNTSISLTIKFQ
jgi:hypothetical protein